MARGGGRYFAYFDFFDLLTSSRSCARLWTEADGTGGTGCLDLKDGEGIEGMVVDFERERDPLRAVSERKCFRPRFAGFSGAEGTGEMGSTSGDGCLSGYAAEDGVFGKCTKTDA